MDEEPNINADRDTGLRGLFNEQQEDLDSHVLEVENQIDNITIELMFQALDNRVANSRGGVV